jgi:hypothetical protein
MYKATKFIDLIGQTNLYKLHTVTFSPALKMTPGILFADFVKIINKEI